MKRPVFSVTFLSCRCEWIMAVTSNTLVIKKLNERNRCFEKETCASTRNKYGAYLWPFRIQHFHQNSFYRRKRRGEDLSQNQGKKKGTTTEESKINKRVTSKFFE